MASDWAQAKRLLKKGIQPEKNIHYSQCESAKGTFWKAMIRFKKLKKYNSSGWFKTIQSNHYVSMDAFYAQSVAIRDAMQRQCDKAEEDEAKGVTPLVPSIKKATTIMEDHPLDVIMGCKEAIRVNPQTGTPFKHRIKDSDGNYIKRDDGSYEMAEEIHMETIPDNDFDDVFKKNVKITTLNAYRYKYFNYIHPKYGKRTVESITVDDIEESLHAAGSKLGDKNMSELKVTWRKIFIVARRKGYRRDDPTELIVTNNFKLVDQDEARKRKVGTRKSRREISDSDFKKVLKIITTDNRINQQGHPSKEDEMYFKQMLAHALVFMRNTGVRPAECFAIQKEDISISFDKDGNPVEGWLAIQHVMAPGEKNVIYLHETKNRVSNAEIPLNKEAIIVILDLLQRAKARKFGEKTKTYYNEKKTVKFNNENLLFTNYYGNLCTTSYIGRYIARLLKGSGIDYGMYTNRHQFGTDVTDSQGVSVAQSLMRHTTSATTLEYIEGNEAAMKKAVSKVGGGFADLIIQKDDKNPKKSKE